MKLDETGNDRKKMPKTANNQPPRMPFGAIWSHLEPFEAIWSHLEPFGAVWSTSKNSRLYCILLVQETVKTVIRPSH